MASDAGWAKGRAIDARALGIYPLVDRHVDVLRMKLDWLIKGTYVELWFLNDRSYGSAKGAYDGRDDERAVVLTENGRRRFAPLRMVFYISFRKGTRTNG